MLVYQRVYVFHLFHFDVVLELPLIFGISEQIFRHAVHQIFGHCGQATRLLLKTDGRSERKQITINYLCFFKKFRFWRNACCYRLPSGIMFLQWKHTPYHGFSEWTSPSVDDFPLPRLIMGRPWFPLRLPCGLHVGPTWYRWLGSPGYCIKD